MVSPPSPINKLFAVRVSLFYVRIKSIFIDCSLSYNVVYGVKHDS